MRPAFNTLFPTTELYERCQEIGRKLVQTTTHNTGFTWSQSPLGIVLDGFWCRSLESGLENALFFADLGDVISSHDNQTT